MKIKQKIKLDHVGWVTNNVSKFESFWVDILGFKRIWESRLTPEITKDLFGLEGGADCKRYKRGDIVIEVHKFDNPVTEKITPFNQFGINHIALHVEDRNKLIQTISDYHLPIHIYDNPKGWQNIFIQDFEDNWVELRETF